MPPTLTVAVWTGDDVGVASLPDDPPVAARATPPAAATPATARTPAMTRGCRMICSCWPGADCCQPLTRNTQGSSGRFNLAGGGSAGLGGALARTGGLRRLLRWSGRLARLAGC